MGSKLPPVPDAAELLDAELPPVPDAADEVLVLVLDANGEAALEAQPTVTKATTVASQGALSASMQPRVAASAVLSTVTWWTADGLSHASRVAHGPRPAQPVEP